MEFRYKLPNLGQRYDYTADPTNHIANYHITMKLQYPIDDIFCKAFAKTLETKVMS